MSNLEQNITPYSKAIVKLLKSPVERTSNVWDNIIHYQTEIQEYISQIGLELIIKKEEGFAFVKQFEDSDGNTLGLVTRRQIGFETSIVLVVLRQILEEFDSNPTQLATEKFISDSEVKDELELFLQEGYNKLKFKKELDKYIRNVVDLGYLKVVSEKDNETKYQIHRIIKEKITLDILQDFRTKLQEYVESV
ncbi:DUF4194 domain-containing protein [Elizabethkingia anophelis]|uniref:DUF4194 domain-containing protein n=1 Tax=Elizabethkingia anophelis TaxID=1117645 RepID=UPI00162AC137|nr:DUF4194 domain-containing protein [Elizabethkingia anophelis]MCT4322284.1 DUF4194 domain-containing protein [Elizabethkingia anophelis]HAY3535348.1 DUF4194 domain-containing protein [Elizabethkingia anophelis]HAY3537358.1 DUF4194 domain-containing protein [Elizabethkingia anophelis]HAY3547464.1 DUF4194 domain-containing protein [Elizabethkingia anophelis]HAY3549272.1 DUF4194 domain-containing protein [Elizabethkingia anophelis]